MFQKKVLKAAAWFFVIFFVCGLVSRGMYGALLPRASVEYANRMYLNHTVKAEGEIVENKKSAILAEEGIRIESVLVENGQSVNKGDTLVQLDMEDLEKLIEEKEIEIKKSQIQIETMEKNEALAKEEKAVSQKRASEDYSNTEKKGNSNVQKAIDSLNEAKEERDHFPSKKEYIEVGKEQDEEYQSFLLSLKDKRNELQNLKGKTADSEEEKQEIEKEKESLKVEIEEIKTSLSACEKALEEKLSEEWETKKEQLNQTVNNLEEESKQTAEQKDTDMLSATRALEDANRESTADSSLELEKLEKTQLEKQLATYKKIKEEGGKIVAPMEGDIVEIHVMEGDRTGDSALLHMTDREKGYRFTAEISKADKKYISLGDSVEVTIGSDKKTFSDIEVEAIEQDKEEEDVYHVSFPVTKEMGSLGDAGTMEVKVEGEKKSFCVPLSAVHSDGSQNYILLAVANQTILGEELKVVRKNVIILDKNESYAAIDEGSITEEDQIITSSTKQINEGDTVRLLEN